MTTPSSDSDGASGSNSSSESSPETSPGGVADESQQFKHEQERLEETEPCNKSDGLDILLSREIADFMAKPVDLDHMTLGQLCRELEQRLGFHTGSLAKHRDVIGLLFQAELLSLHENKILDERAPKLR